MKNSWKNFVKIYSKFTRIFIIVFNIYFEFLMIRDSIIFKIDNSTGVNLLYNFR